MSTDLNRITLGSGDLYLNNVHVGSLSGNVEFSYAGEIKKFKPSTSLAAVKAFRISEEVKLKASIAEIDVANFKLALGVTTSALSSQSFPSYDPSSYTVPASASYDVMKFGGSKTVDTVSLRFISQIPETSKYIVIVLYSVFSTAQWNIPFNEDSETIQEVEFEALAIDTRDAGDQIGFIAHQVLSA